MSEVAPFLESILLILALAVLVRLVTLNHERLSFASLLVIVGLLVSILGISLDIPLTSDLILTILLPTIIYHGTTTINIRKLRQNTGLIIALTLIGLPISIVILGGISTIIFEFPFVVALVFAAVILPTDPAAVLSLFEEFDVTERIAVTIEGESLFNDGVAIVIYSTFIGIYQSTETITALLTPVRLGEIAIDIALIGGGGLLIGSTIGYLTHLVIRRLDDEMTILLLTVLVVYGSFLVTESYLGLSGILAVVGAGLLMGAHQDTHEKISENEYHIQHFWTTASFLVTTILYVLIGMEVQINAFVRYADIVLTAAILVVLIRAITIYPLVTATNRIRNQPVPVYCQHIMVWGGLHTVVPVALALALPPSFPFREEVQTLVFGIAVLSITVQGLLMPVVLKFTGFTGSNSV